jgi:hypothetical protein
VIGLRCAHLFDRRGRRRRLLPCGERWRCTAPYSLWCVPSTGQPLLASPAALLPLVCSPYRVAVGLAARPATVQQAGRASPCCATPRLTWMAVVAASFSTVTRAVRSRCAVLRTPSRLPGFAGSACCNYLFQMFQRYVASVSYGCCKSRSWCYICCNGCTHIL